MKIIVKNPHEGPNIRLRFPLGLIFNRLTVSLGARILSQNGMNITPAQMSSLFNEFRNAKKNFPHLPLAEVDAADGTHVRIIL